MNEVEKNKEFEKELVSLWTLYDTISSSPYQRTVNMFTGRLLYSAHSQEMLKSNNLETRLAMAQLWTHGIRMQISLPDNTGMGSAVLLDYLEAINDKAVLANLLKEEHNVSVIGYACLEIAMDAFVDDARKTRVLTLLDTMLGQSISDLQPASTATMTDHIYGPGVWALYRQDVDMDDELPHYLFKMNVRPQLARRVTTSAVNDTQFLPEGLV